MSLSKHGAKRARVEHSDSKPADDEDVRPRWRLNSDLSSKTFEYLSNKAVLQSVSLVCPEWRRYVVGNRTLWAGRILRRRLPLANDVCLVTLSNQTTATDFESLRAAKRVERVTVLVERLSFLRGIPDTIASIDLDFVDQRESAHQLCRRGSCLFAKADALVGASSAIYGRKPWLWAWGDAPHVAWQVPLLRADDGRNCLVSFPRDGFGREMARVLVLRKQQCLV
jgi:hypothetical protein